MTPFLPQHLLPDGIWNSVAVWRFLADITTNQMYTNVNLGDNISIAISMITILIAAFAAFTVEGCPLGLLPLLV